MSDDNPSPCIMSLYHEAAATLHSTHNAEGSIKSLVYGKKSHKSDPKTLFALSTEAAKWSEVLSEVIEKSGILGREKQVRFIPPYVRLVMSTDPSVRIAIAKRCPCPYT